MKPKKIKKLFKAAKAAMDPQYDLIFTEHDDRLTDKQIALWFRAKDDERNDVENEVYDHFEEYRYTAAMEAVKEAVEAGIRDLGWEDKVDADEWLDEHLGEADELRYIVEERDESNPWKSLLRTTPDQLVRCDLGDVDVPPAWSSDEDMREESISEMAEAAGIDPVVNRKKLEELFDNAGGGYLQVIWYADVEALMTYDDFGRVPNKATLTNPSLIVIDTLNGSGHTVEIEGVINVDLDQMVLDNDSHGYGWNQIAGVYASGYTPDDAVYHRPVSLRKRRRA